jgi:putative transposase
MARIYLVWVDGGYSGFKFLQWTMDTLGWIVEVVLRPKETKGFVLVKKRWIVERTLGWLRWSRRLVQDYEQLPENAVAMVKIAMIRIRPSGTTAKGMTDCQSCCFGYASRQNLKGLFVRS